MTVNAGTDTVREKALADYRKKLIEHKEVESRLKDSKCWKLEFIFVKALIHRLTRFSEL